MSDTASGLDRRRFLALAAAGTACAVTGLPAGANPARPWSDSLIVNALGGLENPNVESDSPDPTGLNLGARKRLRLDERALKDARASGISAVNWTMGYVAGPGDPFERSVSDVALFDRLVRDQSEYLLKVWRAEDIVQAKRQGKVGIIFGFQNAAMLGDKLERVDVFADLGVRVIQLTYNPANAVGDGAMAKENRGLSAFGRDVVARLNANRILIDLSHSGEQTCLEAARASTQPIAITHTGCRALVDLPRNKSDAELRLVAEKGGFVGIYFMPFLSAKGVVTADDVVAHVEHALKICGEDHVGIGTDGTVSQIDDVEAVRIGIAKQVEERRKAGIGAAGEGPHTLPFALDLRGPEQFFELARRLEKRGHSRSVIDKVLGGNFLRLARDVW